VSSMIWLALLSRVDKVTLKQHPKI